MRCSRQLIVFLLTLGLCGCEGTSFRSSVPIYPVHVVIDTHEGEFVHFQPTAINTFVWVNRDGYHYNGHVVKPLPVMDACGYGGVVVYINVMGGYDAYDLACPYCSARGTCSPCEVDGIFATCPRCGEQYDIGSGTAVPQHGIAKEQLLRLNLTSSNGRITVRQ